MHVGTVAVPGDEDLLDHLFGRANASGRHIGQPNQPGGCTAVSEIGPGGTTAAADGCGVATAELDTDDVTPLDPGPTPELPVTVTGADGKKVTVASADRILAVNLYGSLGELVFKIKGILVRLEHGGQNGQVDAVVLQGKREVIDHAHGPGIANRAQHDPHVAAIS